MVYVGFWRRLGAHIIDSVIIAFVGVTLALALVFMLSQSSDSNAQAVIEQPVLPVPAQPVQPPVAAAPEVLSQEAPSETMAVQPQVNEEASAVTTDTADAKMRKEEAAYAVLTFVLIVGVARLVIGTIYHTAFIASKWQATPGKRLVGAMVVTRDGKRVGVVRAFLRHVSCILSAALLLIGYLMICWHREKAALHDEICDTRVIRGEV